MYKISFTFLFDRDNICIFFFQQEIGYTQACVKQTLLFKDFYKLNTSKRFFGCCNFHICLSCFFFFLNQIMRLSSARKSFFFNIQPIQRTVSLQRQMIYIYIRYRLYIMISRPLLELQRFCTSPIRTSLWSLGPSIDLHNILDCLKIIALAKDNK